MDKVMMIRHHRLEDGKGEASVTRRDDLIETGEEEYGNYFIIH
jgi:hypothetical protein